MTKTKTTLKCRIIEYGVFEKSETSIGPVWPAGQARLQERSLIFSLVCRRFGSGQARLQERSLIFSLVCRRFGSGQARLEKNGLLAALVVTNKE